MPRFSAAVLDALPLAAAEWEVIRAQRDSVAGGLRTLRPSQQTPPGDWRTWLVLTGRGWGKTLAGCTDLAAFATAHPGSRLAIVAPTYADARDTCVEGASGLLSVLAPAMVRTWNRSLGELVLTNDARIKLFSADEPDRLRGPQHHRAYCDELGSWNYPAAWDMLQFGLRLGDDPRAVVTTTPRPTKLLRDLIEATTTHITRGSTYDNLDNLPEAFRSQILARYEGTRLGRAEIHGELVLDTPGALFTYEMIRRAPAPADLVRVVVAVDPSGGSSAEHDEQGIVVAGLGTDGNGYVLADRSCRLSPDGWGRRAVQAYLDFAADAIVGEANFGGQMVESVVRMAARNLGVPVTYRAVHAARGKAVRAQPVAALYESQRVAHCGDFPELEAQMTSWTPESGQSPDRLDALVFAVSDVMVKEQRAVYVY